MAHEKPESELERLREEQHKTRRDEIFGGLSLAEQAEYEGRAERIHVLETIIQTAAVAKKSSQSAKTKQKDQWDKVSETDTPQDVARQTYRSREKDSGNALKSSTKTNTQNKVKKESDVG